PASPATSPGTRPAASPEASPGVVLRLAAAELVAFLAGERQEFSVPLAVQGTPFQQLVWAALRAVPHGSTVSYGELAARIGQPRAVRAVASAVGANPVPVFCPCHRVLPSTGRLGQFSAGDG